MIRTGQHNQEVPILNVNITRVWWNWEYDEILYPNWPEFVQTLRDEHDVRTLIYINPFLANVSTKADNFRRNLLEEATDAGYLIRNSTTNTTSIVSSGPGINAAILDLTNPAARSWFGDVLSEQVWSANISGYMCDFGEYTPTQPDTELANRSVNPLQYHNQYPRDWAVLQQEAGRSNSLFDESIIFHRSSAFAANQYMNLFWAGDQDIGWALNDGIKSSVTILGHMGISGYAHGHFDIGGYTTTFEIPSSENPTGVVGRSAELLGRWGELAAVSNAVFRSHEGSIPGAHAQFYTNESTYAYFAYNAQMFASLAPYRRHILETESQTFGWPLLRMPVLYHPEDMMARMISYQSFYLGSDIYVAPVLDPGQQYLEVYMPWSSSKNRTYTHVWSGRKYHGGQTACIDAPYGKPAIFIVDSSENPNLDEFVTFVKRQKNQVFNVASYNQSASPCIPSEGIGNSTPTTSTTLLATVPMTVSKVSATGASTPTGSNFFTGVPTVVPTFSAGAQRNEDNIWGSRLCLLMSALVTSFFV